MFNLCLHSGFKPDVFPRFPVHSQFFARTRFGDWACAMVLVFPRKINLPADPLTCNCNPLTRNLQITPAPWKHFNNQNLFERNMGITNQWRICGVVGELRFHWLLMLSGKSTRSTETNASIDIIILTSCMYRF